MHRASPRYQQGIGELVTDILGHPIETFSQGFRARIISEQTVPIDVEFVDVTEQLGLVHVESPPTDSMDISLIDYDNDGNLDLYLTPAGVLFQNTGGQFAAIQQFGMRHEGTLNPHAAAFADLNKDGTQEFLLHTLKEILLFQIDTTGEWKISPLVQYEQPIAEISVLHPIDYDHDGDLDLFTAGATMYRNNGDGTFTDVGEQTFVTTNAGDASAGQGIPTEALSADFDDDGDIDLFVTHRGTGCTLYDNLRQGRLRAVSNETGIPQNLHYTAAAIGDYDNDGDIDIFLSTADRIYLYLNRKDGSFVDDSRLEANVRDLSPALLRNIDYDNDGFLDLWVSGEDGMFLFRNDGAGLFMEPYPLIESVTSSDGAILQNATSGAVGDYDNDGDLDLFFINSDGQLRALQNNGGNQNNWIQVRLEGITAGDNKVNRDGIGSKLEVKVGDLYQLRYVSEQVSHFGLGAFDTADVVRVVWTNGVPQNVITPQGETANSGETGAKRLLSVLICLQW